MRRCGGKLSRVLIAASLWIALPSISADRSLRLRPDNLGPCLEMPIEWEYTNECNVVMKPVNYCPPPSVQVKACASSEITKQPACGIHGIQRNRGTVDDEKAIKRYTIYSAPGAGPDKKGCFSIRSVDIHEVAGW